jgi:guanosine-3',5'-bis(diphosphate) 3'-pyrophosphohydrolase
MSTALQESLPADVLALESRLAYLPRDQVSRVIRAYQIGAHAHAGQKRKSGEPYITHPVAVAAILADLGMDAETIIAAILHDTLEDTPLSRQELERDFGPTVATLVDGVTKLDKVMFRSLQEAAAESFRKMLLAMARDLRVILIKLADRLHNMRTLGAMDPVSRRRIARETLDIYAPIAQRLGMNKFKSELQELGFRALYPLRHRVIQDRIKSVFGNRREVLGKIESALSTRLNLENIRHRVMSRIKSPFSIYTKMRGEHKTFAQVMDVYGFRVVVQATMECYHALGAVHALYKPLDSRFRDFIAIPKANGYQSLHTVLFGPFGGPIEIQIRTEDMDQIAERGVAAHWSYKTAEHATAAQTRAREWVEGLVDSQTREASSIDFLENVKVDLFPDEVYLFTPKGHILALPRNATALDFAFAVHTDVGTHAVAARVDKKLVPLRQRLNSGESVEIITAPSALPNPQWLEWVVSARARTAIRHFLKRLQHEDAVEFGHRMLDRALDARNLSLDAIPAATLDRFLAEARYKRLEELLADIALGNRMPDQVAAQLSNTKAGEIGETSSRASEKILITGAERGVLSFGNCCYPVPGDEIFGYLSSGKGIVVHRVECPNAPEYRKTPERIVAIGWDREVSGDYRARLRIVVDNKPGVLATVAAAIAERDSNIENVEYQERDQQTSTLMFTIEVRNRKHLAAVMRRVRNAPVVHAVYRYP